MKAVQFNVDVGVEVECLSWSSKEMSRGFALVTYIISKARSQIGN